MCILCGSAIGVGGTFFMLGVSASSLAEISHKFGYITPDWHRASGGQNSLKVWPRWLKPTLLFCLHMCYWCKMVTTELWSLSRGTMWRCAVFLWTHESKYSLRYGWSKFCWLWYPKKEITLTSHISMLIWIHAGRKTHFKAANHT